MRTTIIINPAAHGVARARRGGFARQRFDPAEALEQAGVSATVRETTGPGHATELASEAVREGVDAVIVCAGDGTVREVVDGIAGARAALGVVPCGTGNVLARHLGLPLDPRKACRYIPDATIREVDLGQVNGKRFVLHASAGYAAQIVRSLPAAMKRSLGQPAFVWTAIGIIARKCQWEARVEADGHTWEGRVWDVIVGNAAAFAWKLKVTPEARMDDGVLDVCILHATEAWSFVATHARALFGLHTRTRAVTTLRAKHIRISAQPAAPVQADGDLIAETPVEVQVLPRALRLMVPP